MSSISIPKQVVNDLMEKFWQTGDMPELPELQLIVGAAIWNDMDRLLEHANGIVNPPSSNEEAERYTRAYTNAMIMVSMVEKKRWRGLWLRRKGIEAALCAAIISMAQRKITQEQYDFLTLAHVKESLFKFEDQIGDAIVAYNLSLQQQGYGWHIPPGHAISVESKRFAQAFVGQMVEQAAGHMPILGEFVLDRIPLPVLDDAIEYDRIHLSIVGDGIWFSLVDSATDRYRLGWWSPESHALRPIWPDRIAWMVHVLMACIWRDACIVQHKTFEVRSRASRKPAVRQRKNLMTIVLPRVVCHVQWAHEDERGRILRSTHSVRGHYRTLLLEQTVSQEAVDNAEMYGFALPPEGYTFVLPHIRGEGESDVKAQKVICKGLLAVRTALSQLEQ